MPKTKLKPQILLTREAMQAEVADYVKISLTYTELTARMEREKTEVEKRHADELARLAGEMELHFAAVQNYCTTHRGELFPDKKSIDLPSAVVRFADTPPSVGKRSSRETWGGLAKRLEGLVFYHPDDLKLQPENRRVVLNCSQYVKEADPTLDKNALLADRTKLTLEQLAAMGIRFEQEELFYIEPKSEVAASESRAA